MSVDFGEAMERLKRLAGQRTPSGGIWYLVWLAPEWRLRVFRDGYAPGATHAAVWHDTLSKDVARHYHLDPAAAAELEGLACCMPRGRVSPAPAAAVSTEGVPQEWCLYHGNDIPSRLDAEGQRRFIMLEFGLHVFAARGTARWMELPELRMIDSEKSAAASLLRKIPY